MQFTPISAAIGGALLGFAAVVLLKLNGRIAGVSGILFGAMEFARAAAGERLWRWAFLLGMVLSGLIYSWTIDEPLISREGFPLPLLIGAGLLVGFGTRLGSGCTSGHGVCGLARMSLRSLVATLVFLATGILSATLVAPWLRGML